MEDKKNVAVNIMKSYEEKYNIYYPLVERIINKKIKDIHEIESTLDLVLEIYTEKGFNLFLKLLFYYSEVDMEKSYAYLDLLKEYRKEEYDEYIKKLSM
jgi:hypothetical protein